MSTTSPFVILHMPCADTVPWVTGKLEQAKFQAVRTFDLQVARLAQLDCPCPHHGMAECDCQMVVLLVYQNGSPPATLVVHGSDETSWLYLINTPQQSIGSKLEKNIQTALSVE